MLIDLLGRAQQYTGTKIKQEAQEDAASQVSAETDADETNSSTASKVDEQSTGHTLDENNLHKLDNRFNEDLEPLQPSNQHVTAKLEELHMNALVRVKLEEEHEPVDEEPFESNRGNESAKETIDEVDEQSSFALDERDSPANDNESSNQHVAKKREDLHARIKLEQEPEDIDELREDEVTADERLSDQASELDDEEMNTGSLKNGQKSIIQLIELMQYRVRCSEATQALETIDEILSHKELLTPSVILEFPLGEAIRTARKKFGKQYPEMRIKCKKLSSEMRRIYDEESTELQAVNVKRMNEQVEHSEQNKIPRLALADDVHAGGLLEQDAKKTNPGKQSKKSVGEETNMLKTDKVGEEKSPESEVEERSSSMLTKGGLPELGNRSAEEFLSEEKPESIGRDIIGKETWKCNEHVVECRLDQATEDIDKDAMILSDDRRESLENSFPKRLAGQTCGTAYLYQLTAFEQCSLRLVTHRDLAPAGTPIFINSSNVGSAVGQKIVVDTSPRQDDKVCKEKKWIRYFPIIAFSLDKEDEQKSGDLFVASN